MTAQTDERPTLRVFYAPKEARPKSPEAVLEARVSELEAYVLELENALLALAGTP